jgi:hypothetical protein
MAVEACVKQILCALSSAVLGALTSLITAQKAVLEAQVIALEAQLLTLDVATVPLEIARSAALAIISRVRNTATLVPIELIAGCADLGDFNIDLVTAIDRATAELNDVVDDLNRLLSFKAELNLLVTELNRIIDQFGQIELAIQECAET